MHELFTVVHLHRECSKSVFFKISGDSTSKGKSLLQVIWKRKF